MFPSYFIKLNNSIKLPKNFTFQLSGEYQSKIISQPGSGRGGGGGGPFGGGGMFGGGNTASQGFIRPNYGMDAALRFEFLKNKVASLSLNVNDIFRTRLYDAPLAHDADAIRHGKRFLLIVRNQEKGNTYVTLQVLQFDLHLTAKLAVECCEGFVKQQYGGAVNERPCQSHTLLLTSR